MRLPLRHMLNDYVDVVLLSSGPLAAMAGPQLARHFDLPLALAEAGVNLTLNARGAEVLEATASEARAYGVQVDFVEHE